MIPLEQVGASLLTSSGETRLKFLVIILNKKP